MNESFWIIPLFQNLKNEMSALSLSLALIFFNQKNSSRLASGLFIQRKGIRPQLGAR